MRRPLSLLLLLVCLCLSACVPTMRTVRPKLSGTVTDFVSKKPLEGVRLADDHHDAETLSDARGHYSLGGRYALGYNMIGGEGYMLHYGVTFSKAGYLDFSNVGFGGFGTGQGMLEYEANPRMLRADHPIAVALLRVLNKEGLSEEESEAACLDILGAVREAGLGRGDAEYLLRSYGTWSLKPLFGQSEFCWRELRQGTSIWS
ncbi:carboxypeptidase-like regulatory domain-containing protein [Desulfovibrio sp. OttesenSCG-928-A18]|nr:carboxypeptidase-like regulatory domain-containing protein [Desulfovibrio sp. OttesenSCG-928-A18]